MSHVWQVSRWIRLSGPGLLLILGLGLVFTAAAPVSASAFDFEWIGKIEHEAEGLSSEDDRVRQAAVTAIGRYDIAITKPYLLRALEDPNPRVRAEAGRVLGKHKVAEAEAIIIGWLELPNESIKQDAAAILAVYGSPQAVSALVRSLGDPDELVRKRAAQALGEIGSPRVVVPLIGRLEDDKSAVRQVAIEQLAKLRDARAVIPLVGAFQDSNVNVRAAAITAVGHLNDKSAVPSLLRLLDDPSEDIKSAAVTALGNLGAVAATNTLIDQLGRGTDGYNSRVASALGKLARAAGNGPDRDQQAGDRAVRALVAALASRTMRQAASEALRHAGAAAVPALVAHLDGDIEGDLTAAVELLRDLGDARATPALVLELERGRLPADLVLQALEKCGDERALMPILNLLTSEDVALRLRALTSLRAVATDARSADILIGLLADENPDIRVLAIEYLGLMRARSAVPVLIAHTRPGYEMRERIAAIDALGEIGAIGKINEPGATGKPGESGATGKPGEPGAANEINALLEILARDSTELQRAAANALIYIGDPGSIDRLMALARDTESPARAHAVRALGGVLRDRPHKAASTLLQQLARHDARETSLAAIEALGAMGDASAVPTLLTLMTTDNHRRRATATALGNLGDKAALEVLVAALGDRDDRVSSEAAWALAKLGDAGAADALLSATKRRGWATVVNASAGFAQTATEAHAASLATLSNHRSRLVRVNACMGLGRLFIGRAEGTPADARKALLRRLEKDPSPLVRVAAIRALSRMGSDRDTLTRVASDDREEGVREAARRALEAPFTPPARTDWRSFHVVDPSRADLPVRQEPYFLVASDGLATAHYTDARGIITEERFPPGDYILAPRSKRSNY